MHARLLALLGCFALPACGQEHLTVNGCRCKQSWTEGEVHCDDFCCNPGGGVKWCQVENPTCEDAGWGWCLEGLNSNAPAIPSNCRDRDDWHDLDGDGCSVYKANQWCTRDGKIGIGWHENWGNIGEFSANGFTAFTACCACGGGDLGGVEPGADRSTYSNCKCKSGWDENGMSCEHACCNPDNDPVGEWCMVEDESCESSYWGYCRAGNVPAGEHPSGDRHGRCADVANFKDLDQEGCADYSSKAYCTEVGGYGLGWNLQWGNFDEFVQPGSQSARIACCACGGGKRNDIGFEVGGGTEHLGDSDEVKVRATLFGCECMKNWAMEGIGECKDYCCNPDTDTFGSWCMVKDSNCEDSDWGYCQTSGLGFLEASPRGPLQDSAHCVDDTTWADKDGDGCVLYSAAMWCTIDGKTGAGWHEEWGSVPQQASKACCACGGGNLPSHDDQAGAMESIQNFLSEEPERMWWVASGPCKRQENGCITSGNYPNSYGATEQCQIGVNKARAKPIHVKFWETERRYDVMKVNGELFSGSRQPQGIIPTSTIFWGTDSQDQKKGWVICPRGETRQKKPGVFFLKVLGSIILGVFVCGCGAFTCLWAKIHQAMPHGDGLGAGPVKIGKYAVQEDA